MDGSSGLPMGAQRGVSSAAQPEITLLPQLEDLPSAVTSPITTWNQTLACLLQAGASSAAQKEITLSPQPEDSHFAIASPAQSQS